jgi:cytochrome b involved in lipid metabolism
MLGAHRSEQSCWVAINGHVYDVSKYLETHPGGIGKIMEYAGKDATTAFLEAGHSDNAVKIRE